jgi:transposase-like protein
MDRSKRRQWSEATKRRIVAETFESGSSVSIVARRHDVNANQVFKWRREIAVIGPSSTIGAPSPSRRSAATKVVVFQWPNGALVEEPPAARGAAMVPGHLGAGAGLVDKDKFVEVDKGPCGLPEAPSCRDIRPVLLSTGAEVSAEVGT